MAILKTLFAAKYKGWNIIYTLPTAGDVNTFVTSKVNKIIDNNEFLKILVKDKDTIFQKQVGKSVMYFRGTASGKSAGDKSDSSLGIMLSADLLVHDESDRSDQAIIEQYESRLDFSEYKGKWYFSNPTVPNVGAHKVFLTSDQKHFFHKCSRCNERFYLEWVDKCVNRDGHYMCPKCGRELREEDRRCGEWVRRYRGRDISGYWISQMIAPWKSCKELIAKEENSSAGHFMNFCLGLPYVGSSVVVNRDIIVKNIVLTKNDKKGIVIGVDNGIKKHYVIGNKTGIFKTGVTEDWDEIEKLLKVYPDAIMVIDANPYPNMPKKLMKKYQGKVFISYYNRDKDDPRIIRWGKKERGGAVYSDRNKLFDQVIDAFYNGEIRFNISHIGLEDYIRHWETLYQTKQEDSLGIERIIWESSTGEDHLAHATNFWFIGMERQKTSASEVLTNKPKNIKDYAPVIKDNKIQDETTDIKYIFEKQPAKEWDEY